MNRIEKALAGEQVEAGRDPNYPLLLHKQDMERKIRNNFAKIIEYMELEIDNPDKGIKYVRELKKEVEDYVEDLRKEFSKFWKLYKKSK